MYVCFMIALLNLGKNVKLLFIQFAIIASSG